jgi:uncharacterized delta-60 repeat protein
MKRESFLITSATLLIFLVSVITAQTAPGDLDTSFALTGKTRIGFGGGGDSGKGVAVQADGKTIVVGESSFPQKVAFSIIRYTTNGLLDTSFNSSGVALAPFDSGTGGTCAGVRIQSDGKIVVAGTYYTSSGAEIALIRLNTNGLFDSSFGANGLAFTNAGNQEIANALSLQADGKIVVAGYGLGGIVVKRFLTNGVLDTTFGVNGKAAISVAPTTVANAVALQFDGKILVAGYYSTTGINDANYIICRYTTNGVLDNTFDGDGIVGTDISGNDIANAIAIQPGNGTILSPDKIVVVGSSRATQFGIPDFSLARYNLDGTLDTSFDGDGKVTTHIAVRQNITSSTACGLTFVNVGFTRKIVVAGTGQDGLAAESYFTLVRYNLNGSLDTAFDGDGIAQTVSGRAVAMASFGGKFILTGTLLNGILDFQTARFNFDGSPDTGFNTFGYRSDDIGSYQSSARSVVVQNDGKMILAGFRQDYNQIVDFALARVNPDGSPDLSFGDDGQVAVSLSSFLDPDKANAVVLQPDGKIVAAGFAFNGAKNNFALARFATNGALDTSFHTNGMLTTSIGASNDIANAVAVQADGKIIAAGSVHNGSNNDVGIVRYQTNGAIDLSYDFDGKVVLALGSGNDVANAIVLQPDGKAVVAGSTFNGANEDLFIARFATNGALDSTFNGNGVVFVPFGSSNEVANAIAIQSDGKILAAGYTFNGSNTDFAIVRLNTNGVLDVTFDGDGKVTTQVGTNNDVATAIAIQTNGKILVTGYSLNGANTNDFAAVRYLTNGAIDTAYGTNGKVTVEISGNDLAFSAAQDSLGRIVMAGQSDGIFGVTRLLDDPYLQILSINRSPTQISLRGLGIPGVMHTLHVSQTLMNGSFTPLAPVMTDAAGQWQYDDANGTDPERFYRLSFP